MGKTWQTKWCWYFWCAGGHCGRGGCWQQCVCWAGDNFPHQGQGVPHQLPPKKGWSLMQLTHRWFSFGGVLCRTKPPVVGSCKDSDGHTINEPFWLLILILIWPFTATKTQRVTYGREEQVLEDKTVGIWQRVERLTFVSPFILFLLKPVLLSSVW